MSSICLAASGAIVETACTPPACAQQWDWPCAAPSLGPQSASSLVALNYICALSLFILCISKMCPKVSEEPKRTCKGVMLSIKLDVIKCSDYRQ